MFMSLVIILMVQATIITKKNTIISTAYESMSVARGLHIYILMEALLNSRATVFNFGICLVRLNHCQNNSVMQLNHYCLDAEISQGKEMF